MAKKFKHSVIYNGKFYPANTPVPEAAPKAAKGRKKGDA